MFYIRYLVSNNTASVTMAAKQKFDSNQPIAKIPMEDMKLHAAHAAGLMKALGNESRLMILCSLSITT